MSNFYQEWNVLSIKIKSFLNVFSSPIYSQADKGLSVFMRLITKEAARNYLLIQSFKEKFESSLPVAALEALNTFISTGRMWIDLASNGPLDKNLDKTSIDYFVIILSFLESTVTYCLTDSQTRIYKTVEIAFEHLQRQIVADESVRKTWQIAKKETEFEKLGGAHLLLHKILGFKVNSTGERTDLVLSEQKIDANGILYKSVDGVVLTEWKVVQKQSNLESQINQALLQADLYAKGTLSGIELTSHRYLIMISPDRLQIDENAIEAKNGNLYRIRERSLNCVSLYHRSSSVNRPSK